MGKADLVTGAFGFSGSHLVKQLLDHGRTVVATDTKNRLNNRQRIEECQSIGLDLMHPNLKLIPGDLTDQSSLADLFQQAPEIEMVYNTASLYSYSASLSTLKKINVGGTKNLLATLPKGIIHFVHWSTCGVLSIFTFRTMSPPAFPGTISRKPDAACARPIQNSTRSRSSVCPI